MVKKMHDILPPKKATKAVKSVKEPVKSIPKPKIRHIESIQMEPVMKKERNFPLKELLMGTAVVLFLVCAYAFFKLPEADIHIYPKVATVTLSEKITLDTLALKSDLNNKIIPARLVQARKEYSQEFPATSTVLSDSKATGTIKVSNKLSSAFSLIKGTHFLSDSGKYFVTTEKVVIPATQKKNGKTVVGAINAKVIAEQVGAESNIGASKFSVPKLNGTEYYYSISGESSSAMVGGSTGKSKKVSSDDIESAKEVITKKLLADIANDLKSDIDKDEILLDGAIVSTVVDVKSSVVPNTVADSFSQSATIKISALVFKRQDSEALLKSKALASLSKETNLLQDSLQIAYDSKSFSFNKTKAVIDVNVSLKTYDNINTNDLIDVVTLKSSDQVKTIVGQMYGNKVSELKINFWPFWVKSVPSDKNRIKINLDF